jgi:hypothetical protein
MVGDKTKLKIKYLKILPAGKFFLESQFLPSLTNEVSQIFSSEQNTYI